MLGNAYRIAEGGVVDHQPRPVARVARRLGLSESEDPVKVEQDVMAVFPQSDWLALSHALIYHGRAICQARKPLCEQCHLLDLCPTGQANLRTTIDDTVTAAPAAKRAPRVRK